MFYGREDILDDMMSLWGKRTFDVVEPRYHPSVVGFNLTIFFFGCSPP